MGEDKTIDGVSTLEDPKELTEPIKDSGLSNNLYAQ